MSRMTISVFPLAEGLTSPGLVNGTNDSVEDRRLIVCQLRGVSDAAAVRQHVVAGSLGVDCAAFNSDMVLSPACLLAAAMRVLLHESRDKLVTKTIHSELLLMMSGGRRINEAFRVFGIGDTSSNLLLASFASKEDEVRIAYALPPPLFLPSITPTLLLSRTQKHRRTRSGLQWRSCIDSTASEAKTVFFANAHPVLRGKR